MGQSLRLIAAKAISGGLFAVLATFQLQLAVPEFIATMRQPSLGNVSFLCARVLTLLIPAVIALLFVLRSSGVRARGGRFAALVGIYASFVLFSIRPIELALNLPVGSPGFVATVLANALTAFGAIVALFGLASLRTSFSIVPQARQLRTRGAYRIVRHPVYTGEILSAVALGVVLPSPWTWIAILSFVTAQVYRARREEEVLAAVFADYDEYRQRVGMLLPKLKAQGHPGDAVLDRGGGKPIHGGQELGV